MMPVFVVMGTEALLWELKRCQGILVVSLDLKQHRDFSHDLHVGIQQGRIQNWVKRVSAPKGPAPDMRNTTSRVLLV